MSESMSLAAFVEGWELFRLAALSSTVAGALLGVVGVYVVLRRMVFLTAAVSQTAGLGVTLAFYAQIHWAWPSAVAHPVVGAGLLTAATVLPFALGRARTGPYTDSLLGLGYLAGAAGTLAVGTRIVEELHDVQSLLFGSAVAVLPEDFHLLAGLAVVLLGLHAWWWRGFAAASFDPIGARVRGLPVRLLDVVLFLSLALAVSACTRVLGALPAFAFSVLPAMAATRIAPNVGWTLVLGGVLGAATGFGGYLLAFMGALPVGASQALVGVAFVAIAEAIRRLGRSTSAPRSA